MSKRPRFDPDREYEVEAILDETPDQYLIRWAGDKETGETFDDSWQPKSNANQAAVDEWETRKEDIIREKGYARRELMS